jgi:hypothetical protein
MDHVIEVKKHSTCFTSFKDKDSDFINLADVKWDFLFHDLINEYQYVSIHCFRLESDLSVEEKKFVKSYLDSEALVEGDLFSFFSDLNKGAVELSRNGLAEIWNLYEYPALFFLNERDKLKDLREACSKNESIEVIQQKINGLTVLYKSFERDVLWLRRQVYN